MRNQKRQFTRAPAMTPTQAWDSLKRTMNADPIGRLCLRHIENREATIRAVGREQYGEIQNAVAEGRLSPGMAGFAIGAAASYARNPRARQAFAVMDRVNAAAGKAPAKRQAPDLPAWLQ